MKARMEHFPEKNPNPVLKVEKDGTFLYSNEAGESLLHEWSLRVGEKIPSNIENIAQRVISLNSPEKIEVKVGKKVYLFTLQPLPEEECVNIYGFDISDQKEVEEKLREEEKRYRIVADNAFDWEFLLGPDGRFLYMSPSCERVTGYAAQEFMDNSDLLQGIIHLDDRQAFLQHKHNTSPSHGDIEFRIITKDGKIRWIHHLCQPVYDGKGYYAGNRCSNRDITECRQAEYQFSNELARATGLYELFTRSSNLSDRELYDFALNQAVKITDSMIGFFHLVSEDEKEVILTTWNQETLSSCTAGNEGHYPIEKAGNWVDCVRLKRPVVYNDFPSSPNQKGLPSGHAIVSRFMSVPVTENGKVRIIFGVGNKVEEYDDRDVMQLQLVANELHKIIKLRRIENEVRESEAFLRDIMENVSDAIFLKDREARIILANPAYYRFVSKSPEKVLNKTIADFHPPEIDKNLEEDDKRVIETGKGTNLEERIFTSQGWRILQTVKAPYYDRQGNIIGLIGAARDITEQKQEEHRIRRYNRILEGINWIFNNVVQAKTEEELGEACLSVALEVTGSEFGYIIEMGADGLLHDVAKSKLAWEQCHMYDKTGHICLPHDYVVRGLYGSVIINGNSFFTNDPQSHPDSAGLPSGHPPIKSFLTVPLTLDGKIVGSIGVGNREGGYSYEQQEDLEAIAPAVTQVLQRMKVEQERKQFEEQIRLRAEEMETVMEVAPVAIFFGHDPKCQNITGNLMANELYKAKLGENVSANISQVRRLFHKGIELTANELPMQKAAFRDIDVRNEEIDLLLPSGEWRGLLGSASPLHDAEGNVRGSVGAFIDITERKKVETKLEETLENLENLVKERTEELEIAYISLKDSEEKYRNIVETANEGIALVNSEGMITYVNKKFADMLGYTVGEIIGRYTWDFVEDKSIATMILENRRRGIADSIEIKQIRKDGLPLWVHINSKPIFDNNDKFMGSLGMVTDMTERKRAEEKLRESEEKYRNIVETANEGISIFDSEARLTFVNKKFADMLGYTLDECIGRPIWGFISEEYKPIVKLNLEKRRQGISESYELKLIHKDGSPIWIFLNSKPLFDMDGKYIGTLTLLTDITMRKEAEETLRNFEVASRKEIHHRIKNNLQVVSSLLDLQADLFKGRKDILDSEVLKAFKQSMDRVLSIALIHEELYRGKNVDQLNFSQYIKELAENLILTYRLETDTSFNFDLEEKIFLDMDTAIPLGIIINELITNSFKYAFSGRDKGEIRIKLYREEEGECKKEGYKSISYVLSISDNGVGIPEYLKIEDLDSLGLQLVTSLVDQLDGELELNRNNGTEFIIRLTAPEIENSASEEPYIN